MTFACSAPPAEQRPPGSLAFGVFGDGPYSTRDVGAYRAMWGDAARHHLAWFIHVGDILGADRCDDAVFRDRFRDFDAAPFPVIYIPGDNEWTDCYRKDQGRYAPLERLDRLRAIFFADTTLTSGLGELVCQCADSSWSEFREHLRWRRGGFVFATLHVVGSENGGERFGARSAADDAAMTRRQAAVRSWLDSAFAVARRGAAHGLVLAFHGNPGFGTGEPRRNYREFVTQLRDSSLAWRKPVLVIHGDSHTQRVDQPITDPVTGGGLRTFTRLETFGSPDIGWVYVELDTLQGRVARIVPRRLSSALRW
jgi:hypothetical protein